jgi:hypothetical protein
MIFHRNLNTSNYGTRHASYPLGTGRWRRWQLQRMEAGPGTALLVQMVARRKGQTVATEAAYRTDDSCGLRW